MSAVDDNTIRSSSVNANFNISGGFIFAYGTTAINTEGLIAGYAAVRNYTELTKVGGTTVACAWNQAAGRTIYNEGAADDLVVGPSGVRRMGRRVRRERHQIRKWR